MALLLVFFLAVCDLAFLDWAPPDLAAALRGGFFAELDFALGLLAVFAVADRVSLPLDWPLAALPPCGGCLNTVVQRPSPSTS